MNAKSARSPGLSDPLAKSVPWLTHFNILCEFANTLKENSLAFSYVAGLVQFCFCKPCELLISWSLVIVTRYLCTNEDQLYTGESIPCTPKYTGETGHQSHHQQQGKEPSEPPSSKAEGIDTGGRTTGSRAVSVPATSLFPKLDDNKSILQATGIPAFPQYSPGVAIIQTHLSTCTHTIRCKIPGERGHIGRGFGRGNAH